MPISIDDLLAKVEQEEDTFQFTIFTGDVLTARRAKDADELIGVEQKVQRMSKTAQKRPPENWLPYLPASDYIIRLAVYAETYLIDPAVDFATALRMGKTCGFLLPAIGQHLVQGAQQGASDGEMEAIDEVKNDSGAAPKTDAP